MPKFNSNNNEIYYEIHGKGFPLFLIAGLASDSQSWLPIIDKFSQHFSVVIFDNRGCGRTTPINAEISISQIADDCKALAEHLGFDKFYVLGHSMGGMIALDLAHRFPETVNKMILADTASFITYRIQILLSNFAETYQNCQNKKSWFENLFLWLFTDSFLNDKQQVKAAVKFALDYPYQQPAIAFKNQVEAIKSFDMSENISEIAAKTLIINGKEDRIFSPQFSYDSLKSIPNRKFEVIENSAHSIFLEQPDLFCKSVLNFLIK